MSFNEKELVFKDDRIIVNEEEQEPELQLEVMMSWEDSLMKRHAEVVCENGGDVLEIGFGMGIAANYIQELNPSSHTIVESHPQILEKLREWAADKPNVNIVEGEWYKIKDQLNKYDGVFYDAFGDTDFELIADVIPDITKEGSIFTFWNNQGEQSNNLGIEENIAYEQIEVDPPQNNYFNYSTYYLPKVIV
jgi:protein arginine N-methyltransferase 2